MTLVVPAVARAQDLRLPARPGDLGEGIALTPWLRLKAHLRGHASYSTNPVLAPPRREDDETFLATTVGVDLVASGYHRELEVGYAATFRDALSDDELDAVEQRLRLAASTSIDRLDARLDADAAYLLTPTDPRFAGEVRHIPLNGRLRLNWKQSSVFGFEGQAHLGVIDFRDRDLDFFDQVGWGADLGVNVTPDWPVSFYAGGGWRELRYTDHEAVAPDLGLASASLGVSSELAKVSIRLRGGYERASVLRRRAPTDVGRVDGFVGTAEVTWKVFEKTSVSVHAQHRITFSSTSDYLRLSRGSLGVEQELPFDLSAFGQASYEVQDPRRQPELRSVTGTVGVAWGPRPWFDVGVQVSYTSRRTRGDDAEGLSVTGAVTLKY